MKIRKFDRATLESEPHNVLFRDLYPWDEIDRTPFGASLAVVEASGKTMVHSHEPCETFVICNGHGTMTINGQVSKVSTGDVIYMEPQSVHFIQNDSDTDPLMFLSVFWDAPEEEGDYGDEEDEAPAARAVGTPRLILPSPPTSNGPLHLGHLSGPYIMADVLKRFDRLRGLNSHWVCLTDDHQSYVELKSQLEEKPILETSNHYAERVYAALKAFDAAPDALVRPALDEAYKASVTQAFLKLYAGGHLEAKEVDAFQCCDTVLFDGHVIGACPHCGETSRGFACEQCCLPNNTTDLAEPECIHCEGTPTLIKTRRLFFPVAPFADRLASYHVGLRLSPRLRALAAGMVAGAALMAPPATQVSGWGIPVPIEGFEGQIISPWFEVALAAGFLREKYSGDVVCFFGYDNAFLYLMHDPAVSLALDVPLPVALGPNEYLLLNDAKMSTSGDHALDACEVLEKVPSDLLRLYLAGVRPEDSTFSASLAHLGQLMELRVIQPWQNWLERLGRALTTESGSKAPQPSDFSPEHHEFFHSLQSILGRTEHAYQTFSLQEVSRCIHELIERVTAFSLAQANMVGIPTLQRQRETALALELAAARLLCYVTGPLMPKFAAQLWKFLGFRTSMEQEGWPSTPTFVPPGQRVLATAGLCARKFFPASLNLAQLVARD